MFRVDGLVYCAYREFVEWDDLSDTRLTRAKPRSLIMRLRNSADPCCRQSTLRKISSKYINQINQSIIKLLSSHSAPFVYIQ